MQPVTVLSHNKPAFYMVVPKMFEALLENLADPQTYLCFKLRKQGYRLIYTIEDNELVVLVLAIGKREGSIAYSAAAKRPKLI